MNNEVDCLPGEADCNAAGNVSDNIMDGRIRDREYKSPDAMCIDTQGRISHCADGPVVYKRAHAKINLSLDVIGRRPDGYHLVDMLMQETRLHDDVYIGAADDGEISLEVCDGRDSEDSGRGLSTAGPEAALPPADRDNLMYRAAALMKESFGITSGIHMKLVKRIPMQAGLGGGSSDAAAAAAGIAELFNIAVSSDELERITASLGADVPFFIRGGTQRATGTGTVLERTAVQISSLCGNSKGSGLFPGYVLIIKPVCAGSTPSIYKAYDRVCGKDKDSIRHPDVAAQTAALERLGEMTADIKAAGKPGVMPADGKARAGLSEKPAYPVDSADSVNYESGTEAAEAWGIFSENIFNVLEYAIEEREQTGHIKEMLRVNGAAAASMTGSGSAVYGLFWSEASMQEAAMALRRADCADGISEIIESTLYVQ